MGDGDEKADCAGLAAGVACKAGRRRRALDLLRRLGAAARFAITGVAPTTWFGPQQPLAPMAPPEVKGRQFDYPFGVNIDYTPRSNQAIGFGVATASTTFSLKSTITCGLGWPAAAARFSSTWRGRVLRPPQAVWRCD